MLGHYTDVLSDTISTSVAQVAFLNILECIVDVSVSKIPYKYLKRLFNEGARSV